MGKPNRLLVAKAINPKLSVMVAAITATQRQRVKSWLYFIPTNQDISKRPPVTTMSQPQLYLLIADYFRALSPSSSRIMGSRHFSQLWFPLHIFPAGLAQPTPQLGICQQTG